MTHTRNRNQIKLPCSGKQDLTTHTLRRYLTLSHTVKDTPAYCQHGDLSGMSASLHFPVRAAPHEGPFLLIAAVTHVVVPHHSSDGV